MRRCALRIFVFLLLGAVINVAVAWAAAAYSPPWTVSGALRPSAEWRSDVAEWWLFNNPFTERAVPLRSYPGFDFGRDEGLGRDRVMTNSSAGLELVSMWGSVPGSQHNGETVVYRLRTGWPSLAMCGSRWVYLPGYDWNLKSTVVRGIEVDPAHVSELQEEVTFLMDGRLLPIRPLWPGFAINTVFYAAVLWLLFAAPFALRRRWGIRRGLCSQCAYDLRGSSGVACPECGADIALVRPLG